MGRKFSSNYYSLLICSKKIPKPISTNHKAYMKHSFHINKQIVLSCGILYGIFCNIFAIIRWIPTVFFDSSKILYNKRKRIKFYSFVSFLFFNKSCIVFECISFIFSSCNKMVSFSFSFIFLCQSLNYLILRNNVSLHLEPLFKISLYKI